VAVHITPVIFATDSVGMSEPRCGLVHVSTMQLLSKAQMGDCDATMSASSLGEKKLKKFKHSAFEFKLQVAKEHDNGEPDLLWIRIGVHPQRSLAVSTDNRLRFEGWLNPSAPEPMWRIHYLEAQQTADMEQPEKPFPAMCFLQSLKTGQFLSVKDGVPMLSEKGDIWGLVSLRSASTPGRAMRRGVLAAGAGVAIGSVAAVGVAGAAAVGAGARTAGAVSATGAAVTGAKASIAGAITAAVAIPAAITALIAKGTVAASAAATLVTTVYYGAIGVGCGAALGSGAAVASSAAWLMDNARDPGLYVFGYPFIPKSLHKKFSKMNTAELDLASIPTPSAPAYNQAFEASHLEPDAEPDVIMEAEMLTGMEEDELSGEGSDISNWMASSVDGVVMVDSEKLPDAPEHLKKAFTAEGVVASSEKLQDSTEYYRIYSSE